jgi:leader peptidase (prepilin peptidase)/N-methyltransferase
MPWQYSDYNLSMHVLLTIMIFLLVFIFGATIASFLNVLIYRIPKQLDFVSGRSFCPNCKHPLKGLDLIPIASYLMLGRRCRYCKEPISSRYMWVELSGGVLALLCWVGSFGADAGTGLLLGRKPQAIWQPGLAWIQGNQTLLGDYAQACGAVFCFAVICVLLVISLIDFDTMEIPNGLNFTLAVFGLLSIIVFPDIWIFDRIIGLFIVSLPLLIIVLLIPGSFGGGDLKLLAAAGFLLGWQQLLVGFFVGLLLGGGYGIFALVTRRKGMKEHFPFGPALCTGITIALIWGRPMLDWYLGLL